MDKNTKHILVDFNSIKLDAVVYVKLSFLDEFGDTKDIKTKMISDSNSFLFLRYDEIGKFNITCPIQVNIKIITLETMYQAETTLSEILYHSDCTSFSIKKPNTAERVQEREFYRVKTTNKKAYIYYTTTSGIEVLSSTIFDLSIKSIKIYDLQDANGKSVGDIGFDNLKSIKMKVEIDSLIDVNLPVVFLQHRIQDSIDTYIFQFSPLCNREEMLLSKFLTEVQRLQLRKK